MTTAVEPLPARRGDLRIEPFGSGREHVVKNTRSGDFFLLGEQEHFLLLQLDGRSSSDATRAAFEQRFATPLEVEDLASFVKMAGDAGILASIGFAQVPVSRRPRVAILGTGDELVPLGRRLETGQIHDSNAYTLAAAVEEIGGLPERMGIVPDERRSLHEVLQKAASFDAVLSTGGVSVGDFDHVKEVMDEIGLTRRFWKVAQKPGKPITFAAREGCLYFGLPGNPVSAMVCFSLYVAPALRAALGRRDIHAPAVGVTVGEAVRTARDLTELVRCTLRPEGDVLVARPTGSQSSGVLRSLSLADGLLLSPPGRDGFEPGERATALRLREGIDLSETHAFG